LFVQTCAQKWTKCKEIAVNNLDCALAVLAKHREARRWTDEVVAADLLSQLQIEPSGEPGEGARALALVMEAKATASLPVEPEPAAPVEVMPVEPEPAAPVEVMPVEPEPAAPVEVDDYAKPSEVQWLCPARHLEEPAGEPVAPIEVELVAEEPAGEPSEEPAEEPAPEPEPEVVPLEGYPVGDQI